jgi:DNA-binding FadR family transcriptional regulator
MATTSDTLSALRADLDSGLYAPGERLPAERELAQRLGAGRGTLRKALEALEAEGRIRRRVGQGTFVAEAAAIAALRLDAAPTPADVMETRLMLEPAIAAAAAVRARPEQIAAIADLADSGERGLRVWETRDDAFHAALAEASGNPLLVALLETLRTMRAREDWGKLRKVSHTPERRRAFLAHHRAIAGAVSNRDPKAAAAAMREHLVAVQSAMIDDLPPLVAVRRA